MKLSLRNGIQGGETRCRIYAIVCIKLFLRICSHLWVQVQTVSEGFPKNYNNIALKEGKQEDRKLENR